MDGGNYYIQFVVKQIEFDISRLSLVVLLIEGFAEYVCVYCLAKMKYLCEPFTKIAFGVFGQIDLEIKDL